MSLCTDCPTRPTCERVCAAVSALLCPDEHPFKVRHVLSRPARSELHHGRAHLGAVLDRRADLPPRLRRVLNLRLNQGLSWKRIGESIGIEPRTARERFQRGLIAALGKLAAQPRPNPPT